MSISISPIRSALTSAGERALNAGITAYRADDLAGAIAAFALCLDAEPNNPTALNQTGIALYHQGRHGEALPYFARVIGLKPDLPDVWFRWAACNLITCDHSAAMRGYRRALELAPHCAHYHHGLATLLTVLGDYDAALAGFRRARALQSPYPWAEFSEGLTLLGMGRWLEGWPLMEARRALDVAAKPVPDVPRWDGRELNGQSILLRTEQGIGDMIQFARYVPMVQARGGRVVLEARAELARLFATTGADEVIQAGTELPVTDWQDSMMSMGLRFGTTPEDAGWNGPYLAPNVADMKAWQQRLAHLPRPWVGLCWAGLQAPGLPNGLAINARRSLTASDVFPLVGVRGLSFIALQPALTAPAGVFETRGLLTDMADTAALVACLDLVVTVDTAIVHLAGALECPVWMLDRLDKCWRWLPNREDSPLYPSLRIFRQASLGEWRPVIERVAKELAAQRDC